MTLAETYNQIAPGFDSQYHEPIHYAEEWIINDHIAAMKPLGRVLSAGCGTGHDITMCILEPEGFLGTDISEGMLAEARKKYPNYAFENKAIADPVEREFDTVLGIFGVVNYGGLEVVLERFKEVKATKLFLVMFAPSYTPPYVNGEIRRYTPEAVKHILSEAGLKFSMAGMTFPLPGEENKGVRLTYMEQKTLTKSGNLGGCKYWILSCEA